MCSVWNFFCCLFFNTGLCSPNVPAAHEPRAAAAAAPLPLLEDDTLEQDMDALWCFGIVKHTTPPSFPPSPPRSATPPPSTAQGDVHAHIELLDDENLKGTWASQQLAPELQLAARPSLSVELKQQHEELEVERLRNCELEAQHFVQNLQMADLKAQLGNALERLSHKQQESTDVGLAWTMRVQKVQLSEIEVTRLLGKGTYGKVVLGSVRRLGLINVAIKLQTAKSINSIMEEAAWSRAAAEAGVSTPQIVAAVCDDNDPNSIIGFVMELCICTLDYLIHNAGSSKSNSELMEILVSMAASIKNLHQRGIGHLDIKAQNFLLSSTNHILLSDFGVAMRANEHGQVATHGLEFGTYSHMSPEMHASNVTTAVTVATDIFSLGITFGVVLAGRVKSKAEDAVSKRTLNFSLPLDMRHLLLLKRFTATEADEELGNNLVSLLHRMTALSPSSRPCAEQVAVDLERIQKEYIATSAAAALRQAELEATYHFGGLFDA